MNETAGLGVRRYPGRRPPLVSLHGFTQTGAMYAELADLLDREVLAPDLPGHGRSSECPASFDTAIAAVIEVLAGMGDAVPLVGYSQGGRVALAVALARPELVSNLVLMSATPGIEDEVKRIERRRADEAMAAEILQIGVPAFIPRWLERGMFDGLRKRDAEWQASDNAARRENTAVGLAAALVGMGQGAQPYLGDRLGDLPMPVLVVAGELDQKYASRARAMCGELRAGSLEIVPGAGHAVLGENPQAVAELVSWFLSRSGPDSVEGRRP